MRGKLVAARLVTSIDALGAVSLRDAARALAHRRDPREQRLGHCGTFAGVALAFVPTLFAVPFVINRLLPDNLGERIAYLLDRTRTEEEKPVFPARYNWCFTFDAPMRRRLGEIGFVEVLVLPFYGHRCYQRFPLIRDIHRGFTALARTLDLRLLSTYAYIVVRKKS